MSNISPRFQQTGNYQPVETRNLKRSPNCFFYMNGDKEGKANKVCLSKRIRTFEGIMEELTRTLPRNHKAYGVRKIFTPTHGHRINQLDQLVDGEFYVAGVGTEKFIPLRYGEIPTRRPLYLFHNQKEYNRNLKPIRPVVHPKDQRLREKSGRAQYLNSHCRGVLIDAHLWGQKYRPFSRLHFQTTDTMMTIKENFAKAFDIKPDIEIFNFQYGGHTITLVEQPEDMHKDTPVLIVKGSYSSPAAMHKLENQVSKDLYTYAKFGYRNLQAGKVTSQTFGVPPEPGKHRRPLNKYSVIPSIPSSKQSGGPISPYSNPPSQGGRKQHSNRSRPTKEVDYDQDKSGVYRAKGQDNARGARQVNETRDTRTERPIDQMEAEEVEEEEFPSKEKTTPIPPGTELNKKPSKEQKQDKDGKKKNSEVKKNSNKTNGKTSSKEKLVVSEIPPVVEEDSSSKIGKAPPSRTELSEDKGSQVAEDTFDQYKNDKATPNELKTNNASPSKPPMSTTPPDSHKGRNKEKINEDMANTSQDNVDINNEQEEFPQDGEHQEHEQEVNNERQRPDQWDDSFNQTDRTDRSDNQRNSTPASTREARQREEEEKKVKAATKLQAGARGWQARKEYQTKKQDKKRQDDARRDEESRQEEEMRQQNEMRQQDEMKRREEEKRKEGAASKIQAGFKGYQVRKDMRAKQQVSENYKKSEKEKNDAAIKIQSGYKGYITRKYTHKREKKQTVDINANKDKIDQEKEKRESEAATKIQSSFKGYKVRKDMNDKKKQKYQKEKEESAKKIQASFQGYKVRKEMAKQIEEKDKAKVEDDHKEVAAVKIQAGFKGYKTRKEAAAKKEAKHKQKENEAATKIQAAARGYSTRRTHKLNRKEPQLPDSAPEQQSNDDSELNTAATKIQSAFKGYQTRKEIKSQVTSNDFEMSDLVVDQLPEPAISRFTHRKGHLNVEKKHDSVTNVQITFKAYRSRKRTRNKTENKISNHHVDVLTAACRGYLTRKRFSSNLFDDQKHLHSSLPLSKYVVSKEEKVVSQINIEHLQAAVQGYIVRKNAKDTIQARSKVMSVDGADYFATLIQSLCRGYLKRHDLSESKPTSAISVQGPTSPKYQKQSPVSKSYWEDSNIKMYSDKTLRLAATRIQATYSMYKTRLKMHALKLEQLIPAEQTPYKTDEQANAAVTLRKQFTNFAARKLKMKEKMVASMNDESLRPKSSASLSSINSRKRKRGTSGRARSARKGDSERVLSARARGCSSSLSESEIGMNADTSVTLIERKSSSKIVSPRSTLPSAKDKAREEVEMEGESLREVEDDEGELSSITKNVNAVSQLQAAFWAYRLRREISELVSGGGELIDITKIDRAVSALRKDFTLRSAKVRRLGFEKSKHSSKNWWDKEEQEHTETSDVSDVDIIKNAFKGYQARRKLHDKQDERQSKISFLYPRDGEGYNQGKHTQANAIEKHKSVDDNYRIFLERQKAKEKVKSAARIVAAVSNFKKRKDRLQCEKERSASQIIEAMKAFEKRKVESKKRKEIRKLENKSTIRSAFEAYRERKNERLRNQKRQSTDVIMGAFLDYKARKSESECVNSVERALDEKDTTSVDAVCETENDAYYSSAKDNEVKTDHDNTLNESEVEKNVIRNAFKLYAMHHKNFQEKAKIKKEEDERAEGLMIIKAREEAKRAEIERERGTETIRAAFQSLQTRKERSRVREKSAKSHSSTRSLHVEMHSNILASRATELQAAFAGYQVRRAFLSLTKLVESDIHSLDKSHLNPLERMGSLSETDDFKLKHKSLAKLHAFNERHELQQSRNKAEPISNSEAPRREHLPLIPYKGKSPNGMIRSKTGITVAAVRRDLGSKSYTQPEIFPSKHYTKPQSKIELYIKQKMAATHIQSSCRGYLARKGAVFKQKEKQRKASEKATKRPKSSKSNRVSFTLTPNDEKTMKRQEPIVDQVNVRMSSVKLEAERRKLLAGTLKLKKETDEAKQGTSSLKVHAEKRKEEKVTFQRENKSALCIQKTFRGYKVRKSLKDNRLQKYEHEYEEWKYKRINAAIAIQSSWRGYVVRKDLQEEEEKLMDESNKTLTESEISTNESSAGLPELIIINIGRTKSEIERAEKRYENANMVQMVVRASKMRRKMQIRLARRRLTNNVAASKIQALYRSFLTRRLVPRNASATRLQTIVKAHMAREKRYAILKDLEKKKHASSSSLQAAYLGWKKRVEVSAAKELKRQNEAATNIKSVFKGYSVRKELCVKREYQVSSAATRMQACVKGRKERVKQYDKKRAATLIISAYRSYIQRHKMRLYKEKIEREESAATRLQVCYRSHACRLAYVKFRERMIKENKASTLLQGAARGKATRDAYSKYQEEQRELERKRQASAVKIQATYRGHKGRMIARDRRNAKRMSDDAKYIIDLILNNAFHYVEKRSDSADRIQATIAGHQTRHRVTIKLKVKAEKQQREKHSNASVVQAMFRARQGRNRVLKVRERHKKASTIQAMFRSQQGRSRIHQKRVFLAKETASSKMQAVFHGRRTREYYRQRQLLAIKNTSASLIQNVARVHQARNRLKAVHELCMQNLAATKIQALYRGYSVRLDIEREKKIVSNLRPPVLSARTRSGRKLTIEVDDVLMRNAKAMILFHRKASELQASFRAYLTRKEMKQRIVIKSHVTLKTPRKVVSSIRPSVEDNSAILIQKTYRGYSDRKSYKRLVTEKRKAWHSASTQIQASVQGYRVRKEARMRMKQLERECLDELLERKRDAADVISFAYRGLARKRVRKACRFEM